MGDAGKSHFEYLPTLPATQVMLTTSKPWCAGHHWRHRSGFHRIAHMMGHRIGVLRRKSAHDLVGHLPTV